MTHRRAGLSSPGLPGADPLRSGLLLHGRQFFWIFGLWLFLLWLRVGVLLPVLLIGRRAGNRRLISLLVWLVWRLIWLLVWPVHILLVWRLIRLVRSLLIPHDASRPGKIALRIRKMSSTTTMPIISASNDLPMTTARMISRKSRPPARNTASPPAPATPVTISISHLSFLARLPFTIT